MINKKQRFPCGHTDKVFDCVGSNGFRFFRVACDGIDHEAYDIWVEKLVKELREYVDQIVEEYLVFRDNCVCQMKDKDAE